MANGFIFMSFSLVFAARSSAKDREDDENGEKNQSWS